MKLRLALQDVKVVEYGNLISAPFCSKLLADLGAEVIKVEPPGEGDVARRRGPFLDDILGSERSGLFLYLNTNKRGVTLNLEKATGRQVFKELIRNTDILIEDTQPGKLSDLGLGYSDLKSLNPSLVMTSITPFGQTGPYKNYKGSDLTGWHMGGIGYVTPRFASTIEQEPLRVMQMADFVTGITGAVATMCALRAQRRTRRGQQVDVSQLEAINILGAPIISRYIYEYWSPSRVSVPHHAPTHFIKCKDGWVFSECTEEQQWQRFVDMMGNPGWAEEELFQDGELRSKYWESLEPLILDWTMKHGKAEIFAAAKEKKIPLAPANSLSEVVGNKQLLERRFFVDVEHAKAGRLTYPGAPYKFSRTPWAIRRPAPLLGQHNRDVYCNQLGYSQGELVKMYQAGII